MLIFNDARKMLLERINEHFDINGKDVYFDESNHSDITVRIFSVMKRYGKTGEEIYDVIKKAIEKEPYVERTELKDAYVNIYISRHWMLENIVESVKKNGIYPDVFQEAERVSVEHTSANPTGPLHVGRARNSIIGDSIYRLVQRYGYRAASMYFVNDSGKQMISLYTAYTMYGGDLTVENLLSDYQRIYREMENDHDIEKKIAENIERYEKGDSGIYDEIRKIASVMLDGITGSLARIGIIFDEFNWESDLLRNGSVKKAIESIETEKEDNACFTRMQDRKIFLTRNDGTTLYFARDIAYHLYKAENYEWIIDVLGEDHKDHGKMLDYVLKKLVGLDTRISFVFYSFISLESGKMSTRKGNIVSLPDLIERMDEEAYNTVREKRPELDDAKLREISEAVASSSIRFSIVKVSGSKPITFRWDEALNFEGNSAPFIMYSYARASSILRKAEEGGDDYGGDLEKDEADLIKQMYIYPYAIAAALSDLRPDILASYILDLVKAYNNFYGSCKVIGSAGTAYNRRIMILKVYRTILEDCGSILGIRMIEEM